MKRFIYVAVLLFSIQLFGGVVYTAEQTITQKDNKPMVTDTRISYDSPHHVRVDFLSSDNPVMHKGTYMVTRDGKTLHFVNPEKQQFSKLDMEAFVSTMGSVAKMTGGMVKMHVEDIKAKTQKTDETKTILGYRCRHYIMDVSYTMKMKVAFIKKSMHTFSIRHIWATKDIPVSSDFYQQSRFKTGFDELDRLIEAQAVKVPGFILRMVTTDTTTNKKGRKSVSKMVLDVTSFKNKSLADTLFSIPKGYEEVPFMVSAMQNGQEGGEKGEEEHKKGGFSSIFKKLKGGE